MLRRGLPLLVRPRLAAYFTYWRRNTEAEARARAATSWRHQLEAEVAKRASAEAEGSELHAKCAEQAQYVTALRQELQDVREGAAAEVRRRDGMLEEASRTAAEWERRAE